MTQALYDMHSKKIVHMDVKLQNVLVGDGDVYKVSAFDLAKCEWHR